MPSHFRKFWMMDKFHIYIPYQHYRTEQFILILSYFVLRDSLAVCCTCCKACWILSLFKTEIVKKKKQHVTSNTVKPAHVVTSIKESLVSKGHLSDKTILYLFQRWPLNKCLTVLFKRANKTHKIFLYYFPTKKMHSFQFYIKHYWFRRYQNYVR
jgi:hypothetical protein